jgi:hypothetical protein
MSRVPKIVWVMLVGGLLLLPQIGSFGLWEPHEIHHADVASDLAGAASFADITVGGKYGAGPVLPVWLSAIGIQLLGTSELAARLPLALTGLLGLLLAFHLGRRLIDDWAGIAAAVVLATTPSYLFQSRQLGGDIVFQVALLAAAGGLTAYLGAEDGARKRSDLLIATLGLIAAPLCRGLLLGWLLPLLAVGVALIALHRLESPSGQQGLTLRRRLAVAWPGVWPVLLISAALFALALVYLDKPVGLRQAADGSLVWPRQGAWLVLGGIPRSAAAQLTFERPLHQLGYALFPWIALLPLTLASFARRSKPADDAPREDGRRLAELAVCAAAVFGYLASVAAGLLFGANHFPVLSLLAFGIGLWLRRYAGHWRDPRALRWPFGAMVALGLLLVVQQDFYVEPETLAFHHLLEQPTYPVKVDLRLFVRLFGIGLALLAFFALSGLGLDRVAPGASRWRRALRWVSEALEVASIAARPAAVFAAVLFAGWCAHVLTPKLSLHMSNKALYQTYDHCRGSAEAGALGQYRVTGRGAAYYTDGDVEKITSQADLVARLRRNAPFYAVIPAAQLGAIDQAARRQRLTYYVLDARSSKYLIISNQLTRACSADKNPLRAMVLADPPKTISKRVRANFENKVELIGYDVPDVVRSGGSFEITLYYRVTGRMPSGYKIFMHFDKPASRFHGDHKPLGEMYPTQYWLAGDYIVDKHEIELPLLTTSPGVYTIYTGFWLGDKRLKVVEGPNDGSNRVRLGRIQVRVY